jgi:glycosyltransferase involved in cell wall biosynthesis
MVVAGGAERMTFEVLAAVRSAGGAVHCVLNGWAYTRIAQLADAIGATWSCSAYDVRLDRRSRDPRVHAAQVRDVWRVSRDLIRVARVFKPTHVLVADHDTVLRNLPALLVLRARGVPVVFKLCNAPAEGTFYQRLWRWVIGPVVDRFVANSEFTERALIAYGIPPRKIARIPETLPQRGIGSSEPAVSRETATRGGASRIVFVGQVIPPKGLHLLLEAVGLLAAKGRDVSLDVVGDVDGWMSPVYGDYRVRLKARASAPDLADRVRWLGWHDNPPAVIAGADALCCPSLPEIRESFGLVVLEAKTVGVPAVIFRTGALPEQVHHRVDGFICDTPTAASLAEGLEFVLADPVRRDAAGRAALASADQFSRDRFWRAWLDEFAMDQSVRSAEVSTRAPGLDMPASSPTEHDASVTP